MRPLRTLVTALLILTLLGASAAHWPYRTAEAAAPGVTGVLRVETLDPALLESSPALEWYDPDSLTESTYLFPYSGKRALLVVKPCREGAVWAVKEAISDAGSITLNLAPIPAPGTGDWRTVPVLVQLPQVEAGDQRSVVLLYKEE